MTSTQLPETSYPENLNKDRLISRRGFMLVLSSPSGTGKTTISHELLKKDNKIDISISATTRAPRDGEEDGIHYHFMQKELFQELLLEDKFLEWAEVFGNYYGTPMDAVEKSLSAGRDILFDIDWQGTRQIRQKMREDLVSIFILPPSAQELEQRLVSRGKDSADVIEHRMNKASSEISHWDEYDYVIVNRDIEDSVRRVKAILMAERLKRERRPGLVDFIQTMRSDLEGRK